MPIQPPARAFWLALAAALALWSTASAEEILSGEAADLIESAKREDNERAAALYDRDAALEHFERAAKLAPASVRNQYGLGLFWARDGEAARARSHFERAVALPCSHNTERLFCDFMKQTARREIARLAAK